MSWQTVVCLGGGLAGWASLYPKHTHNTTHIPPPPPPPPPPPTLLSPNRNRQTKNNIIFFQPTVVREGAGSTGRPNAGPSAMSGVPTSLDTSVGGAATGGAAAGIRVAAPGDAATGLPMAGLPGAVPGTTTKGPSSVVYTGARAKVPTVPAAAEKHNLGQPAESGARSRAQSGERGGTSATASSSGQKPNERFTRLRENLPAASEFRWNQKQI